MNIERLSKLADFLEKNVTDEQFDLNNYWSEGHCGSVGCALGWGGVCFKDDPDVYMCESYLDINNIELTEHYIGNEEGFFDITEGEADYLFYAQSFYGWGITRLQEIELIREFVEHGGINLKLYRPTE